MTAITRHHQVSLPVRRMARIMAQASSLVLDARDLPCSSTAETSSAEVTFTDADQVWCHEEKISQRGETVHEGAFSDPGLPPMIL
jgi:hypothetical protein